MEVTQIEAKQSDVATDRKNAEMRKNDKSKSVGKLQLEADQHSARLRQRQASVKQFASRNGPYSV